MIKWIRTSRLSIKKISLGGGCSPRAAYRGTSLISNSPLLGPHCVQGPMVALGRWRGSYERGTPVSGPAAAQDRSGVGFLRLTASSLGKLKIIMRVCKAHRLLYHSTLGSRVIKQKKKGGEEKEGGCSRAGREVVQEVRVLERLLGRYPRIRLVIQLLT